MSTVEFTVLPPGEDVAFANPHRPWCWFRRMENATEGWLVTLRRGDDAGAAQSDRLIYLCRCDRGLAPFVSCSMFPPPPRVLAKHQDACLLGRFCARFASDFDAYGSTMKIHTSPRTSEVLECRCPAGRDTRVCLLFEEEIIFDSK